MANHSKSLCYHNLFHKNRSNPRKTWRTLNNLTGRGKSKLTNPLTIKSDTKIINDPDEAVNYMNNFFSNIGTNLNSSTKIPSHNPSIFPPNSHYGSFVLTEVTEEEVIDAINGLKSNAAPGYDEITVSLLKITSAHIAAPLVNIFNSSFNSGIFPSRMKIAKITPIHKKGSQLDVNKYRPISLLPSLSKCLEKIMFHKLHKYLSKYHIITES